MRTLPRILILVSWLCGSQVYPADSVLHLANAGEPETLDPHKYNLRLEETLLNDLFEGLTTFDARGNLVPGAAESWHTSDDGLTWTFNLRRNLRWSDGEPLTARDFVYAFRRLQDPNTAASLAYFMYMLKNAPEINAGKLPVDALGVHAPDAHTLVLELERPYPYLLERLLYPTAFPVPAHAIRTHGSNWVQPRFWVSNGAYTLRDWQPQAHVELSANTHFHDPAPLERVRYHPVVNEQSAYNRFRNGELHAIGSFPAGELDAVRRGAPAALHLSDLLSMMYLVFNVETGALADQRVRQALSMAIDQNMLTEKVLRNGSKPAYSFVPSMVSGYRAVELPHRDQSLSERQARARQLLQAAGFTPAKPLRLTLRHVNTLEGKKLNLAIAGMWQQAGVETTLLQADLRNHFAELRQGNFEVAWAGWIGENNAEHYLGLLQSDIGDVNYGRFADLEFDTLMAAAQKEASLTRRNAMLRDAEGAVIHHYAVVPLYTVAVRRLVDPKLQGWHDNNRDMHQARYLHF